LGARAGEEEVEEGISEDGAEETCEPQVAGQGSSPVAAEVVAVKPAEQGAEGQAQPGPDAPGSSRGVHGDGSWEEGGEEQEVWLGRRSRTSPSGAIQVLTPKRGRIQRLRANQRTRMPVKIQKLFMFLE